MSLAINAGVQLNRFFPSKYITKNYLELIPSLDNELKSLMIGYIDYNLHEKENKWEIRENFFNLLGKLAQKSQINQNQVLQILESNINDSVPECRCAIARSLKSIKNTDSFDALLHLLLDEYELVCR